MMEAFKKTIILASSNQHPGIHKPELAANKHPPQEIPLTQDTGYTLAPYELPSKHRSHQELRTTAPLNLQRESGKWHRVLLGKFF